MSYCPPIVKELWLLCQLTKDLDFTNVDVLSAVLEGYTAGLGSFAIHYVLGFPLNKLDLTALFITRVDGSLGAEHSLDRISRYQLNC